MAIQPHTPTSSDPTADEPEHSRALTAFIASQLAAGVYHGDVLCALLGNFRALATVHPCCTAAAGRAALQVGGQLLAATFDRPANATTH